MGTLTPFLRRLAVICRVPISQGDGGPYEVTQEPWRRPTPVSSSQPACQSEMGVAIGARLEVGIASSRSCLLCS